MSKHIGDLPSILKQFNCCMDISSFKVATVKEVWQLIQQANNGLSIDLKDTYAHNHIVSIMIALNIFFGRINLIHGRFCCLG